MKKYITPARFTTFYIEPDGRDGSLAISAKKVLMLSDEDMAEIWKMDEKVAGKMKELPDGIRRCVCETPLSKGALLCAECHVDLLESEPEDEEVFEWSEELSDGE